MNYGFNLAAGGVLTAMHRQDVWANNLANIETAGFKIVQAATIPRAPARIEDGLDNLPSNRLLEQLGAGVLLAPSRTNFSQGPLQASSNPLDVALQGEGFFMVELVLPQRPGDADGEGASAGPRTAVALTRDGRFTLNKEGVLVTVTDGAPVLDGSRGTITLNPVGGKPTIDRDGTIRQGGRAVARIGVVDVADRSALKKLGTGRFTAPESVISSARRASAEVVQGSIERSNVDAVQAMMRLSSASSDASAATRIMGIHDELMGRAINTLGRVS